MTLPALERTARAKPLRSGGKMSSGTRGPAPRRNHEKERDTTGHQWLETQKVREKLFLFGVRRGKQSWAEVDEHLAELERLVATAGGVVVGSMVQELRQPRAATLIGSGKVEELRLALEEEGADAVVFDHELAPAQQRNLTDLLGAKVLERAQVILDIFVRAAKTREAKLQVELAQMEYLLPRLAGLWKHLERQRGGIGVRGGPGEAQIELDRRLIRDKIAGLKKRLQKVGVQRKTRSKRRQQFFRVALVGYTNAGKSTLMNRLTGSDVYVADQLFATLDSTVKALSNVPGKSTLLIDTVGFIRKLPHQLVASFHSTLEAVLEADLLLIVADSASEALDVHLDVVADVLGQIGAGSLPRRVVLNKLDAIKEEEKNGLAMLYSDAFFCSAKTGQGMAELRSYLESERCRWGQEVRRQWEAPPAVPSPR